MSLTKKEEVCGEFENIFLRKCEEYSWTWNDLSEKAKAFWLKRINREMDTTDLSDEAEACLWSDAESRFVWEE